MLTQNLTHQQYIALIMNIIPTLEGLISQPKDLGDGEITIGYGYTFARNNNLSLWTQADIQLTTEQTSTLKTIDSAPDKNTKNLLASEFQVTITKEQATRLLEFTYQEYDTKLDTLGIPESNERAALLSILYNLGKNSLSNMPSLVNAINGGNRVEAWFQIRYNTNGGSNEQFKEGIAKRRFLESELFGLYDSSPALTQAENIYTKLTINRDKIFTYEARYGQPADGSTSQLNLISLANVDYSDSGITVSTLKDILTPARNAIIADLNTRLPPGAPLLIAENYNPASLMLRNDAITSADLLDGAFYDSKLGTISNNILIGRSDRISYLTGGAGSDILVGGDKVDNLNGGAGADFLYGGKGIDQYRVDIQDTINDGPTGDGLVLLGGQIIQGGTIDAASPSGKLYKDANGHTYQWSDSVLVIDGGLTIQNFFNGALGITLRNTDGSVAQSTIALIDAMAAFSPEVSSSDLGVNTPNLAPSLLIGVDGTA
ncbi:hypothetical protein [Pseudomonas sp. PSE14]|uniref:glycoside hydrolase family protein n=1 Tax=Pseudomonas sp. PSE14 TaxID=3016341 RepID=UPI0023D814F6|nr:hypothetical protein [Pseudomonas sp. PSE14]WEJ70117.1 hypothetical protein O6P39_15675 [Pseudomonas sp. PSE14]